MTNKKPRVTVLSWNVEKATAEVAECQADEVLGFAPDVIALQEVVKRSLPLWRDRLLDAGFSVASSIDLLFRPGPDQAELERRWARFSFNLTASCHPMTQLGGLQFAEGGEWARAHPEKHLAVRMNVGGRLLDVHNTHVPYGARKTAEERMIKVHAYEAIVRRLEQPTPAARVLVGDFNSPWEERDPEGPGDPGFVLGGTRQSPEDRARWERSELAFLDHPEMRDVYRANRQPGEAFAVSHYTKGSRVPRRYDHVYASPEFDIAASRCEYVTRLLRRPDTDEAEIGVSALSDHAPVVAALWLR